MVTHLEKHIGPKPIDLPGIATEQYFCQRFSDHCLRCLGGRISLPQTNQTIIRMDSHPEPTDGTSVYFNSLGKVDGLDLGDFHAGRGASFSDS
jgi:hypothetical protein